MIAGSRLPAEWRGRARLLRDKIAEAHDHWFQAVTALTEPLQPRDGFTPQFTQETLRITAARWQNLPEWGRLRIASKLRNRSHLQIVETRLCPFRVMMQDWDDSEPSVAVMLTVLDLRLPSFYRESGQVLGAIGLHALGRRYERGADRSDGAVLRDLFAIAYHSCPVKLGSPARNGMILNGVLPI